MKNERRHVEGDATISVDGYQTSDQNTTDTRKKTCQLGFVHGKKENQSHKNVFLNGWKKNVNTCPPVVWRRSKIKKKN